MRFPQLSAVSRRRWLIGLSTFLLIVVLTVSFHRPILTGLGNWLLEQDSLQKSDAALVLSGESGDGLRTREAVRLYQKGMVKRVVLSGARGSFGFYESDFSAPLALSLGVPLKDLIVITHRADSTLEEAQHVIPEMERDGIHSFIIVTSNFHTRRARFYFEQVVQGRMRILVAPTDDEWFRPDTWWLTRPGRKVFLLEAVKTLTSRIF